MTTRFPTRTATGLLAISLALAGCSAASTTSGGSAANQAATSSGQSTAGSTAAAGKVNANSASASELTAALTAAGVTNAARWAKEIDEYRPYTASDLSSKLTSELAKYNIDQTTLATILATLQV